MNKKRLIQILKGIITILLFFASSYIQIIPIHLFNIDINNYTEHELVIVNTFTDIILLVLLILIYFKDLKEELRLFKNNLKENLDIGFKYWTIGIILMCVSNILINFLTPLSNSSNEEAVQTMISSAPYLMLLTAGIIAPIIEELTFRKGINQIIKSKWLFPIISGLIFGYLHVASSSNPLELLYIIPYGGLGFFLALSYSESKSIFTPISMHIMHNTLLVLISIIPS